MSQSKKGAEATLAVEKIVDYLNELAEKGKEARKTLDALIEQRVEVSENHPFVARDCAVVCRARKPTKKEAEAGVTKKCYIGVLGLINGIVAAVGRDCEDIPLVTTVYDADLNLEKFSIMWRER